MMRVKAKIDCAEKRHWVCDVMGACSHPGVGVRSACERHMMVCPYNRSFAVALRHCAAQDAGNQQKRSPDRLRSVQDRCWSVL